MGGGTGEGFVLVFGLVGAGDVRELGRVEADQAEARVGCGEVVRVPCDWYWVLAWFRTWMRLDGGVERGTYYSVWYPKRRHRRGEAGRTAQTRRRGCGRQRNHLCGAHSLVLPVRRWRRRRPCRRLRMLTLWLRTARPAQQAQRRAWSVDDVLDVLDRAIELCKRCFAWRRPLHFAVAGSRCPSVADGETDGRRKEQTRSFSPREKGKGPNFIILYAKAGRGGRNGRLTAGIDGPCATSVPGRGQFQRSSR